ncbi:MAG TPA: hypothetical protein VL995_05495 [Cellvibrio sp.]|nr:hypothetical protein [Cellvibrio sp.]
MTIVVNAYELVKDRDRLSWRNKYNGGVGNKRKDDEHAERLAYESVMARNPSVVHLVQNGFPCTTCDDFFKKASTPIVMLVTANEGKYSKDHKLPADVACPVVIYYYKGTKKVVGMWSRSDSEPPAGFPEHADIQEG